MESSTKPRIFTSSGERLVKPPSLSLSSSSSLLPQRRPSQVAPLDRTRPAKVQKNDLLSLASSSQKERDKAAVSPSPQRLLKPVRGQKIAKQKEELEGLLSSVKTLLESKHQERERGSQRQREEEREKRERPSARGRKRPLPKEEEEGRGQYRARRPLSFCGSIPSVILYEPYSWRPKKDIDLSPWESCLSPAAVEAVCTANSTIESLSLHDCPSLSPSIFIAIGASMSSSLSRLDLSRCSQLSDEGICVIASRCSLLSSLSISHCPQLTGRSLLALAEHSRNLTALDGSGCPSFGGEVLNRFISLSSAINSIALSRCPLVSDENLQMMGQHWTLGFCELSHCERVGDAGVQGLLTTKMKKLHSLSLAHCSLLTDDGCRAFLEKKIIYGFKSTGGFRSLKSLDISGCRRLTELSLSYIAAGCTNLQKLIVEDVGRSVHGRRGWQALGSLQSLVELSVSPILLSSHLVTSLEAQGPTDEALLAFLEARIALTCPSLQSLSLSGCTELFTDRSATLCVQGNAMIEHLNISQTLVSDEALREISSHCRALTSLDLSHCPHITAAGLLSFSQRKVDSLTELNISFCPSLRWEELSVLKHFRALRVLEASGVDDIRTEKTGKTERERDEERDASPGGLADSLPVHQYRDLSLSDYAEKLDDDALEGLAHRNRALLRVNLSRCRRLTNKSIKVLLSNCPQLKEIEVPNCEGLRMNEEEATALEEFVQGLRELQKRERETERHSQRGRSLFLRYLSCVWAQEDGEEGTRRLERITQVKKDRDQEERERQAIRREKEEDAAIRLQSLYRGHTAYEALQRYKKRKKERESAAEEMKGIFTRKREDHAAWVIQRSYRVCRMREKIARKSMRKSLSLWKKWKKKERLLRKLEELSRGTLSFSFTCWKDHAARQKKRKSKRHRAMIFWRGHTRSTVFHRWKEQAKERERERKYLVTIFLIAIPGFAALNSLRQREREEKARLFHRKNLLAPCFTAWGDLGRTKWRVKQERLSLLRTIFLSWKDVHVDPSTAKRKSMLRLLKTKRTPFAAREEEERRRREEEKQLRIELLKDGEELSLSHFQRRRKRLALRRLRFYASDVQRQRKRVRMAVEIWSSSLETHTIRWWKQFVRERQRKREERQRAEQHFHLIVLRRWRRHCTRKKQWRLCLARVSSDMERLSKRRRLRSCLLSWCRLKPLRLEREKKRERAQGFYRRSLLFSVFSSWKVNALMKKVPPWVLLAFNLILLSNTFKAWKSYAEERERKRESYKREWEEKNRAATRIQAIIRGKMTRIAVERWKFRYQWAVLKAQALWRRRSAVMATRQILRKRRLDEALKRERERDLMAVEDELSEQLSLSLRAASVIKHFLLRVRGAKMLSFTRHLLAKERAIKAAQGRARHLEETEKAKKREEERQQTLREKAVIIQKIGRGFLERKRHEVRLMNSLKDQMATIIQAAYRGRRGRRDTTARRRVQDIERQAREDRVLEAAILRRVGLRHRHQQRPFLEVLHTVGFNANSFNHSLKGLRDEVLSDFMSFLRYIAGGITSVQERVAKSPLGKALSLSPSRSLSPVSPSSKNERKGGSAASPSTREREHGPGTKTLARIEAEVEKRLASSLSFSPGRLYSLSIKPKKGDAVRIIDPGSPLRGETATVLNILRTKSPVPLATAAGGGGVEAGGKSFFSLSLFASTSPSAKGKALVSAPSQTGERTIEEKKTEEWQEEYVLKVDRTGEIVCLSLYQQSPSPGPTEERQQAIILTEALIRPLSPLLRPERVRENAKQLLSVARKMKERKRLDRKATVIQSAMRGFLARRAAEKRQEEVQKMLAQEREGTKEFLSLIGMDSKRVASLLSSLFLLHPALVRSIDFPVSESVLSRVRTEIWKLQDSVARRQEVRERVYSQERWITEVLSFSSSYSDGKSLLSPMAFREDGTEALCLLEERKSLLSSLWHLPAISAGLALKEWASFSDHSQEIGMMLHSLSDSLLKSGGGQRGRERERELLLSHNHVNMVGEYRFSQLETSLHLRHRKALIGRGTVVYHGGWQKNLTRRGDERERDRGDWQPHGQGFIHFLTGQFAIHERYRQSLCLPVTLGGEIPLRVAVVGGSPPYKYHWVRRRKGEKKWVSLRPGTSSLALSLSPSSPSSPSSVQRNDLLVQSSKNYHEVWLRDVVEQDLLWEYACRVSDEISGERYSGTILYSGIITLQGSPRLEGALSLSHTSTELTTGMSLKLFFLPKGGTPPYSVSWTKDGNAIWSKQRCTENSPAVLSLPNLQVLDGGSYGAIVTCATGGRYETEQPIVLKVAPELKIMRQPQPLPTRVGGKAEMSVSVEGGCPPYSYRWFHNGNLVFSSGTPSLSLSLSPSNKGIVGQEKERERGIALSLGSSPSKLSARKAPVADGGGGGRGTSSKVRGEGERNPAEEEETEEREGERMGYKLILEDCRIYDGGSYMVWVTDRAGKMVISTPVDLCIYSHLDVLIHHARKLDIDSLEPPNPFVTVQTSFPERERLLGSKILEDYDQALEREKRSTTVRERTRNPVWGERLRLPLSDYSANLSLLVQSRVAHRSMFLGKIEFPLAELLSGREVTGTFELQDFFIVKHKKTMAKQLKRETEKKELSELWERLLGSQGKRGEISLSLKLFRSAVPDLMVYALPLPGTFSFSSSLSYFLDNDVCQVVEEMVGAIEREEEVQATVTSLIDLCEALSLYDVNGKRNVSTFALSPSSPASALVHNQAKRQSGQEGGEKREVGRLEIQGLLQDLVKVVEGEETLAHWRERRLPLIFPEVRKRLSFPIYRSLSGHFHEGEIKGEVCIIYEDASSYKGLYIDESCVERERGRVSPSSRPFNHWGVWRDSTGTVYEGERVDNHFDPLSLNGFFIITSSTEQYIGEMRDSHRHGSGELYVRRGETTWGEKGETKGFLFAYLGSFFQGERHGKGRCCYDDGSLYEGEWERDFPHGYGVKRERDGTLYEGEMRFGIKHGIGVEIGGDGHVYRGEFYLGQFHGRGALSLPNGDYYAGTFSAGELEGEGEKRNSKRERLFGNFRKGRLDGQVRVERKLPDGSREIQRGLWEKGYFVAWTSTAVNPLKTKEFVRRFLGEREREKDEGEEGIEKFKPTSSLSLSLSPSPPRWDSLFALVVAKRLPLMPDGVDPEDPEVQEILSGIILECGDLVGKSTEEELLVSIPQLEREISSLSLSLENMAKATRAMRELVERQEEEIRQSTFVITAKREKAREIREEIEYFWKNEPENRREHYLASLSSLKALRSIDWRGMRKHHFPPLEVETTIAALSRILFLPSNWKTVCSDLLSPEEDPEGLYAGTGEDADGQERESEGNEESLGPPVKLLKHLEAFDVYPSCRREDLLQDLEENFLSLSWFKAPEDYRKTIGSCCYFLIKYVIAVFHYLEKAQAVVEKKYTADALESVAIKEEESLSLSPQRLAELVSRLNEKIAQQEAENSRRDQMIFELERKEKMLTDIQATRVDYEVEREKFRPLSLYEKAERDQDYLSKQCEVALNDMITHVEKSLSWWSTVGNVPLSFGTNIAKWLDDELSLFRPQCLSLSPENSFSPAPPPPFPRLSYEAEEAEEDDEERDPEGKREKGLARNKAYRLIAKDLARRVERILHPDEDYQRLVYDFLKREKDNAREDALQAQGRKSECSDSLLMLQEEMALIAREIEALDTELVSLSSSLSSLQAREPSVQEFFSIKQELEGLRKTESALAIIARDRRALAEEAMKRAQEAADAVSSGESEDVDLAVKLDGLAEREMEEAQEREKDYRDVHERIVSLEERYGSLLRRKVVAESLQVEERNTRCQAYRSLLYDRWTSLSSQEPLMEAELLSRRERAAVSLSWRERCSAALEEDLWHRLVRLRWAELDRQERDKGRAEAWERENPKDPARAALRAEERGGDGMTAEEMFQFSCWATIHPEEMQQAREDAERERERLADVWEKRHPTHLLPPRRAFLPVSQEWTTADEAHKVLSSSSLFSPPFSSLSLPYAYLTGEREEEREEEILAAAWAQAHPEAMREAEEKATAALNQQWIEYLESQGLMPVESEG